MEKIRLQFFITEYEKLKDEQHKRIEFRDQMIYLTLAAIGTIFSFAIQKPEYHTAFLILPFLSFVMGWTYLVNDDKITSIGLYIKDKLVPEIIKLDTSDINDTIINWELHAKSHTLRKFRKTIQLFVDLFIFGCSAVISVITFFILTPHPDWFQIVLGIAEISAISFLVYLFLKFGDL